MPGLFGTLISSSQALTVFDKALTTIGNNINNASTPGYAKQRLKLVAAPMQLEEGLNGGVRDAGVQSYRDVYAEEAVRRESTASGYAGQTATDMSRLEGYLDINGKSGIAAGLTALFNKFSNWSLAPNDTLPRQQVIDQADLTAQAFRSTANDFTSASVVTARQIQDTVNDINNLASNIRDLNQQLQTSASTRDDPSIDARLNETLEELSQYTRIDVLRHDDGSVTVLMEGQYTLVDGGWQYKISAETGTDQTIIRDSNNKDITADTVSGTLGSMVETRNTTIPAYVDQLNALASRFADDVNNILATGVDLDGNSGAPLFEYDSADRAAITLRVSGITTNQLAGASVDKPQGNENALNLAALANGVTVNGVAYGMVNGATYNAYYGRIATQLGQAVKDASYSQQTHNNLLLQAKSMREQISGVTLDEEASLLMQFQRSYQATARVFTTVRDLTEIAVNLVR